MRRWQEGWIYLAVGCGAALGAVLRMLSGAAVVTVFDLPSYIGTGFVNVVGSFIIVFFALVSGPDGRVLAGAVSRQFVMAGLCGGFTTFSAMSLDAFTMLGNGWVVAAALYLVLVVFLSLAAGWLGYLLAVRCNR